MSGDVAKPIPKTDQKTEEEKTDLVREYSIIILHFTDHDTSISLLQSEEDKLLQDELNLCVERLMVSTSVFVAIYCR